MLEIISAKYKVDVAVNRSEAWELIKLNDFDVIVTDWLMPEMVGIELIFKS